MKGRAGKMGLTLSDFIRQELGLKTDGRERPMTADDWVPFREDPDALDPKLEEQAKLMEAESGHSLTYCRAIVRQQAGL